MTSAIVLQLQQQFPGYEEKYGFKLPRLNCPTCTGLGQWTVRQGQHFTQVPCICSLGAHTAVPSQKIRTEELTAVRLLRERLGLRASPKGISIADFLKFYTIYIPTIKDFSVKHLPFNRLIWLLTPLVDTSIQPTINSQAIPIFEHGWLLNDFAERFKVSPECIYSHYRSIKWNKY